MTVPAGVERPMPTSGGMDPMVHAVCTDCYPQSRLGVSDGTFQALCGHQIPYGDYKKGSGVAGTECVVCIDLARTHWDRAHRNRKDEE